LVQCRWNSPGTTKTGNHAIHDEMKPLHLGPNALQAMDFAWDEEKRLKNIEKHGTDFIDADILFGNPPLEPF
jgi:hypothetical protein